MKGLVFTELLQMAEGKLGEDMVDGILDSLPLTNDGAYSAVGNYPCSELVSIVSAISDRTGIAGSDLQRLFGHHMLGRFAKTHPAFFESKNNMLDLLEAIEGEVHVEVRKLYPDAELPTFQTERLAADTLRMSYSSTRPLSHFCHGLIEACARHFDTEAKIEVLSPDADPTQASFLIRIEA